MNKPYPQENASGKPSRGDRDWLSAFSWMSAAVFILGLALLAGIHREKNSLIDELHFTGHHFTGTEELEGSFESPVGLHPDSVRFMDLMDRVSGLPYIKKARVRVEAGGKMIVDVQEREPLALLVDGGNRAYIDKDGIRLPVKPGKSPDVPLLHGFSAVPLSDTLSGREFESVRDFLSAAKENGFGWITISEVLFDNRQGVVALSLENGVKLLFGRGGFDRKMDYWEAFYSGVIRQKGIEQFTSIDLRYQDQVVTR
ncbi:MAG: cell division protein FtsQ/DivIB [Balneolaceae bacterium]